jgi:hypothetical protein
MADFEKQFKNKTAVEKQTGMWQPPRNFSPHKERDF